MNCPHETFAALESLPVRHAFTRRVPGLDVQTDRATALARLQAAHEALRGALGMGGLQFRTAEQIHGARVAVVDGDSPACVAGVDGLITADPGVCLGIYVADCGPVFFVEPERRVIACVHSGRKGTAAGIARVTVERMRAQFGCDPARIVVQLGPCVRPPHYEVDFAGDIVRHCREAGVREVHDCGTCTASNLALYYSYRREMGRTGRMLALLALSAG